MKISVLSDLHLEFTNWQPPEVRADVVVLAGDIHIGTHGLEWARRSFPRSRIVYVPGNHEYYGERIEDLRDRLFAHGRTLDIDVLEMRGAIIEGVRFLGATLWTDFALEGESPEAVARAMSIARAGMNDYGHIHCGADPFTPELSRALHLSAVQWLGAQLGTPFDGPTVVVTHHLPHRHSIHPKFRSSPMNPGFVSDLARLMGPSVALWAHGHTHESLDYEVRGTRVVCNPRGYAQSDLNPSFDPLRTYTVIGPHSSS